MPQPIKERATKMAWRTLSLNFQQTYEGGWRFLDKCGEFMLHAAEKLDLLAVDAVPTGAKMEIPEAGVHTACDSRSLIVSQELPVDDGEYFLNLCVVLADLAMEHFQPKGILRNGFLWKSHIPFGTTSDMLAASLKCGGNFQENLGRTVGMVPEHKTLNYNFVSGSKDLHVVVQPVTFERGNLAKRNVDSRAPKEQRSRLERFNKFAERVGASLSYGLALDVDLIENDPPKANSLEAHFGELKQKYDLLTKLLKTK